jgi:hypothetical protein
MQDPHERSRLSDLLPRRFRSMIEALATAVLTMWVLVGLYVALHVGLGANGEALDPRRWMTVRPLNGEPIDTEALQARLAELDSQMDAANAAMLRLTRVIKRSNEESADSVRRIADLRRDVDRLAVKLPELRYPTPERPPLP